MTAWDVEIFSRELASEFLEDLAQREDLSDIADAIYDAVTVASAPGTVAAADEELGLAAATVVAIWAGAPLSDHELVENYPFLRRSQLGNYDEDASEELLERAGALLDAVDSDVDVDAFIEAVS